MTHRYCVAAAALILLAGCSKKPAGDLPPLFPATGTVVRGGQPVDGGLVQFRTDDPDLLVNGTVKADGTFELQTLHALSQKKATGAPAGTYRVTYLPPGNGQDIRPIALKNQIVLKAEPNDLKVDLGAGKK